MNEEQKQNIENVISLLGEKAGYQSQDVKAIIDMYSQQYSNYNVAVSDLALDIYDLFRKDTELRDYGLDLLREISPTTWKNRDEQICSCEDRLTNNILNRSGMDLEENHKNILELFSYICNKFRELDIDYYLVGGFPCYLKTDGILRRFHSDIDFMINEKDIGKLEQLIKYENWHFYDNRLNSKKVLDKKIDDIPIGEHEIIAKDENSTFHIGGVCFRRGPEGELINREYFTSDTGEPMVMEIENSLELTKLEYPDEYSEFNGVLFKSCSLESTYVRKKLSGRKKDIGDVKFLEQYIDKDKAQRYETLLLTDRKIRVLPASKELDIKRNK